MSWTNPQRPLTNSSTCSSAIPNYPRRDCCRGLGSSGSAPSISLDEFEPGNAGVDLWLRRHALAAQQMDSARTFVLVQDGRVLGYFSLTMGSVQRLRTRFSQIGTRPAFLIQLGWSCWPVWRWTVGSQGRGFGALLLAEAPPEGRRPLVSAAAARLVVVDAIDQQAAQFYARHGFIAVPEYSSRLYRRMKDVRMSLERGTGVT